MDDIEFLIQQAVDSSAGNGSFPRDGGLAVAVIQSGQSPRYVTRGLRERDHALPVTERTRFELCSLTKAFTALTAWSLARERGLTLDAPLSGRTARFQLADAQRRAELSLRDVLAHRAGLPANDLFWYLAPRTESELSDALARMPGLDGGFRRSFVYGNLLYGMLGHAFDDLFGVSWADALVSRVTTPLKLSSISRIPDGELALPYVGTSRARDVDTSVIAAAGGLRGNIVDMGRWLGAWVDKTGPLAQPEFIGEALSAQMPAHEVNPLLLTGLPWVETRELSYGLGWFLGLRGTERVAFHTGFIDGFSQLAVLLPNRGVALAILSNVNFTPLPGQLAATLLDALVEQRRTPLILNDEPLLGRYHNEFFGDATLVAAEGRVYFEHRGHRWPWQRTGDGRARVDATLFGLAIPLEMSIQGATLKIPLSLDPRVAPAAFERI